MIEAANFAVKAKYRRKLAVVTQNAAEQGLMIEAAKSAVVPESTGDLPGNIQDVAVQGQLIEDAKFAVGADQKTNVAGTQDVERPYYLRFNKMEDF